MKKLLLAACLAVPSFAFALQVPYIVKGKVGNFSAPAKVYMVDDIGVAYDSAAVVNGAFTMRGRVSTPTRLFIMLDTKGKGLKGLMKSPDADINQLFLEGGTISILGTQNIATASITGTLTNRDFTAYKKLYQPLEAEMQQAELQLQNATAEQKNSVSYLQDVKLRMEGVKERMHQMQVNFIKMNPNSWVSFDLLSSMVQSGTDITTLGPLYYGLSRIIKESADGKSFGQQLRYEMKLAVGSPAPNFTQPDKDGNVMRLTDLRGKYVLLDFWASWCVPCRKDNPNLVKVYNNYKDKNFTILGISLDSQQSRSAWLNAVAEDKLPWLQVSDLLGWPNQAAATYLVQSLPQNYLIDPQGKIIAKNLSTEALQSKLAALLK